MSRRRRKFGRRHAHSQEMVLQITSMADIFTIILVFLLKSASMGVTTITPASNASLPEALHSDELTEALKIEISPESILVDDQPVATLAGYQVDRGQLESDGTIRPLNVALGGAMRKKMEEASRNPSAAPTPPGTEGDKKEDPARVLLLADRKTPYAIVKTVMDSAANQGFSHLQLVVVEDK